MTTAIKAPGVPRRKVQILKLRKPLSRWKAVLLRVVTAIAAILFWQFGAIAADTILIPTFTETMEGLWELAFVSGDLWPALAVSNVAMVLGYGITVMISVPLGLAMARWQKVDAAVNPITAAALALPVAPLIPIVLVAMGLGLAPRVFIIVLFAWVYVVTNVRVGVRTVPHSLIDMARSFGASEGRIWWRILIPGAIPAIFTGLRLGLSRAFAGMVIVELIMLPVGIGALMMDYRGTFQSGLLYAITFAVVLEGVILVSLMQRLERALLKWK